MISHLGELVPSSLPTAASSPRDMAVACCRALELCFGPLPAPVLPAQLARLTIAEVTGLITRFDRRQRIEEHERAELAPAQSWRLDSAGVQHENTARLRSAMWAQSALRAAIATDPDEQDHESRQFLPMLQQYLAFEWRLWHGVAASTLHKAGVRPEAWQRWAAEGVAPEPLPERTALANLHAWLWQREALHPHRQPTQESLRV